LFFFSFFFWDGDVLARQIETTLKCLMELLLVDGREFFLHNFPQASPLSYRGRTWQYVPFPIPPSQRKMGEDAQSLRITLPNVGSSQHGYLPIRDWAQDGTLDGAYFILTFLVADSPQMEQTFTIAEKEFRDDGENGAGQLILYLRQPDDAMAMILTDSYTEDLIGPGLQYRPG
jgi:hypothetical protein